MDEEIVENRFCELAGEGKLNLINSLSAVPDLL